MQPYIAAPISPELAAEMESVLERIRTADRPEDHRQAGVELIIRLTEECLDYYFLRSVEVLGLGKLTLQATRMGLKTASSGIAMFVRRAGKSMTAEQILQLTDMVEELVLEVPDADDEAAADETIEGEESAEAGP